MVKADFDIKPFTDIPFVIHVEYDGARGNLDWNTDVLPDAAKHTVSEKFSSPDVFALLLLLSMYDTSLDIHIISDVIDWILVKFGGLEMDHLDDEVTSEELLGVLDSGG